MFKRYTILIGFLICIMPFAGISKEKGVEYKELVNYIVLKETIGGYIEEINIDELNEKLKNEFNYVEPANFEIFKVVDTIMNYDIDSIVKDEYSEHGLVYSFFKDKRVQELSPLYKKVSNIKNKIKFKYNEYGIEIEVSGQEVFVIKDTDKVLDEGIKILTSDQNYGIQKDNLIYNVTEIGGGTLIKREVLNGDDKKILNVYFVKPDTSYSNYVMAREDFYKTMDFYTIYNEIRKANKKSKVMDGVRKAETYILLAIFLVVFVSLLSVFFYNLKKSGKKATKK